LTASPVLGMTSSHSERDRLVLSALRYTRKIARNTAQRVPGELDDIISAAYLGLLDAAARYDAGRGVPFEGFAHRRIVGAIRDYLRGQDFVGRRTRSRINAGELSEPSMIPIRTRSEVASGEGVVVSSDPEQETGAEASMAVDTLCPRHREFVALYTYHGYTLREIGLKWGVTESRVSQIKAEVECLLRERNDDQG
jgi:RNA polymerase sigma factor FliA